MKTRQLAVAYLFFNLFAYDTVFAKFIKQSYMYVFSDKTGFDYLQAKTKFVKQQHHIWNETQKQYFLVKYCTHGFVSRLSVLLFQYCAQPVV